jgi:PAS domain S-box-containing protein
MTSHGQIQAEPTPSPPRDRRNGLKTGAPRYWRYIDPMQLTVNLFLGLIAGSVILHFFGARWALTWIASICIAHTANRLATNGLQRGDRRMFIPTVASNALILLLWSSACVALWFTGNKSAWVWTCAVLATLAFHTTFAGQRNFRLNLIALAIPLVPLLYVMIAAGWQEYPWWIAILSSIASFGTIACIGGAAYVAHQNYLRMKKAVTAAKATQERLEFAIESAGDGYFELDFSDMIYRPNPKLALSLGFDPGEKDMTTLRNRVHPDDAEETFGNLGKCVQGDLSGWDQDLRARVATGGFRWMHLRARVLVDGSRRILIGTLVDLSERKALEASLRTAKETAEDSSRFKSEFLANMSHEIRTPLNGVLGMAQSLAADPMPEAQKEKVAVILESGKSLMALLNDVLDLSKIEAGRIELAPVPGELLHTIERTRQLFQSRADEKGLDLVMRESEGIPERLLYDPLRVRQCISNLLSNAIKFTETGRIEISASAQRLEDRTYLISVTIADTGIGMNQEVVARLFSAFTQADGGTTRRFGGTGLGLAISRHLARLMGGDITATSAEGAGSAFVLTFRAEAAFLSQPEIKAATTHAAPIRDMRGARVLLTDDNAINRKVIRFFLQPQGCAITEATNGQEALDLLAAQPFDIVLLDVHMPVMDGTQTIKAIRAAPAPWRDTPVIALTADAMSGDREKYLALGMDDYVAKPVDQRELIAKMQQLLSAYERTPLRAAAIG